MKPLVFAICLVDSYGWVKLPRGQDVWREVAIYLALALAAGLLHRWLLAVTYCVSIPSIPTFAWTEWHAIPVESPFMRETGRAFWSTADGGALALAGGHLALWFGYSYWHSVRLERKGEWTRRSARFLAMESGLFCAYVGAWLSVLAYESGLWSPTYGIWTSPPFIAVACGCLLTALAYWRVVGRLTDS